MACRCAHQRAWRTRSMCSVHCTPESTGHSQQADFHIQNAMSLCCVSSERPHLLWPAGGHLAANPTVDQSCQLPRAAPAAACTGITAAVPHAGSAWQLAERKSAGAGCLGACDGCRVVPSPCQQAGQGDCQQCVLSSYAAAVEVTEASKLICD